MKKIFKKEYVITFMIILLPLLIAYIGLFRKGYGFRDIIPYWSDEANYYHILESILDYGMPLGYNGYNGSSAIIGTFGFHGFVLLLPYFLFAAIFGLYPYTIAICNVLFVILALALYKLLVKPKNKEFIIVSIVASFSPLIMTFFTTNMLEGLNIFVAITLSAFFIRLIKNPTKKIYILSLIFIIFATLCKITWGISILPWLILLMKGCSIKKMIVSGILSVLFIVLNYVVFFFVSAPYFTSQLSMLIDVLKYKGLWHGGLNIISIFLNNLSAPFIAGLKSNNLILMITSITFIVMIVFQIFLFAYFILRKVQKKDICNDNNKLAFVSLWLFFSTYFGVSLLYSASLVALRTLYPIFTCCLLLYVYSIKIPRLNVGIAIVTVITFLIVLKNDIYYDPRLFSSKEYQDRILKQRSYMQDHMNIDRNLDRWDNTIAVYLNVPVSYWESAPSGAGYNLYIGVPKNLSEMKAKYILVMNEDQQVINTFLNGGYIVHATDGITSILTKK